MSLQTHKHKEKQNWLLQLNAKHLTGDWEGRKEEIKAIYQEKGGNESLLLSAPLPRPKKTTRTLILDYMITHHLTKSIVLFLGGEDTQSLRYHSYPRKCIKQKLGFSSNLRCGTVFGVALHTTPRRYFIGGSN